MVWEKIKALPVSVFPVKYSQEWHKGTLTHWLGSETRPLSLPFPAPQLYPDRHALCLLRPASGEGSPASVGC
ncbi:hypothetical protein JZ751_014939 [Albula glossodonta]|uniref:Uncharacterized protein n=1 Tax=Albula glossodonta TaxID=121402 RepID=A0A8T2N063_9TELE|nr:hypothetical protein JZ751_014939 [Albula glossodonta]